MIIASMNNIGISYMTKFNDIDKQKTWQHCSLLVQYFKFIAHNSNRQMATLPHSSGLQVQDLFITCANREHKQTVPIQYCQQLDISQPKASCFMLTCCHVDGGLNVRAEVQIICKGSLDLFITVCNIVILQQGDIPSSMRLCTTIKTQGMSPFFYMIENKLIWSNFEKFQSREVEIQTFGISFEAIASMTSRSPTTDPIFLSEKQ